MKFENRWNSRINNKRTRAFIIKFFVILLIFLGCKNSEIEFKICPKSSFIDSFPKRTINLANQLGDTFSYEYEKLLEPTAYEDTILNKLKIIINAKIDTITIQIDYNRKMKTNTLINLHNMDTIFHGFVSKYRGLFYMTEKINDSTYWIGAIDIKFDSIKGLGRIREQMCDLDDYLDTNANSELIQLNDTVNGIYRLFPDKKNLKRIYPLLINKYTNFKIISENYIEDEDFQIIENIVNLNINSDFEIVSNNIIESYYPNPATDKLQIDFRKKDEYYVQLIDRNGKIILSKRINDYSLNLNLEGLNSGFYILRTYLVNEKIVENKKLIIK